MFEDVNLYEFILIKYKDGSLAMGNYLGFVESWRYDHVKLENFARFTKSLINMEKSMREVFNVQSKSRASDLVEKDINFFYPMIDRVQDVIRGGNNIKKELENKKCSLENYYGLVFEKN